MVISLISAEVIRAVLATTLVIDLTIDSGTSIRYFFVTFEDTNTGRVFGLEVIREGVVGKLLVRKGFFLFGLNQLEKV